MTRKATADTQLKTLRREFKLIAQDRQRWSTETLRLRAERQQQDKRIAALESDIEGWKARFDALLRRDQA